MSTKSDIRTQVTDAIIEMLETSQTQKWACPWKKMAKGMPKNFSTGRNYTGVNILLLWRAMHEFGYSRNEWLTFKQAAEIGANVRKGAKGVMGVFFKMMESREVDEEGKRRMVPMLKPFWVFNVADIENLPAAGNVPDETKPFDHIDEAEFIMKAVGAKVQHGGDRAAYNPAFDLIRLPEPQNFERPVDYYATASHELVHWTGHESRLAREFGKRFGDAAYAFEELVAEMGSAFLMADLGLHEYTLQGHANYVNHWLSVLRKDKSAIFTAAKAASAAHAFIMARAGHEEQTAEQEG